MKNEPATYVLTLVFATFLMGSSFIVSKILLRDFAPFWLVSWRFVVAAAAMIPVVAILRTTEASTGITEQPNWPVVILIGLLQMGGTMGLLFLSMQYISAANAAILLFTNPIWVALLGYFLLDERLGWWQVVSLLAGLLGVGLAMGLRSADLELQGNLPGLGVALFWAASTIVGKRYSARMHPLRLTLWQMLAGGVVLLTISLTVAEQQQWPVTANQWGWFLWLALPASAGSFGLWFLALQRGGAVRSSSFLFLAPLFATLLSVAVLGTSLSGWQLVGGVLVGLSIYGMNARQTRLRPSLFN